MMQILLIATYEVCASVIVLFRVKETKFRQTVTCLKSHHFWLVAEAVFESVSFPSESVGTKVASEKSGPRL